MSTDPKPLSPYHLRQMADNLEAFDLESALRQIDLHVTNGDVTEADAETLRRKVKSHAKIRRQAPETRS